MTGVDDTLIVVRETSVMAVILQFTSNKNREYSNGKYGLIKCLAKYTWP